MEASGPLGPRRSRVPTTAETITALVHSPELHALGALLPARGEVGRPRVHPGWSVMLFGALARHYRSAARAHAEMHSTSVWEFTQRQVRHAAGELGMAIPPALQPPTWGAWANARNAHLATDEGLVRVAAIHLDHAAALAHDLDLCQPSGGGSWSHPAKTRTAYGDGTLVTPIYRPPTAIRERQPDGSVLVLYPDPRTGELLDQPAGRYDPDAAEHHGKGGPAHATNYVAWHVRGGSYYERVILTIGRVDAPGHEADTAVTLLGDVRRALGDDLQAAIYDGAFHGTHISHVMRHYGYVVISKPGTYAPEEVAPSVVRLPGGRLGKSYPLGTWEHTTPAGACTHLLAAVNGAVSEIGLDETGDPVLLGQLARRQVKRPRRSDGSFHFSVGYEVPCPLEPFWVWISPHADHPDKDAARAENVRIIAATDPDGQRIVGLRSDAEAHHYHYKRTLLVGRAMSLGWRRGLLDQYCFALLNNAVVRHRHIDAQPAISRPWSDRSPR
jgi:hypothetical protein